MDINIKETRYRAETISKQGQGDDTDIFVSELSFWQEVHHEMISITR